ncbi:VanZ family protein [uncultured Dubosiella sp.]|uniref:VanZ family protein n=1 Tax=uncultured Dubosiella sp. TaxID=1937011 RepID=UPI0025D73B36|nr:VanZ family protein [uncultured Dubosiella sp.]
MAGIKRKRQIFMALTLGLMIAIFLFSSQPGDESSSISFFLARFLVPLFGADLAQLIVRKTAHFTIYMVLGFCVYPCFDNRKKFWLGFLVCVLYACSDEVHQLFVAGRSGRLLDVLIDSLGSLSGLAVSCLLNNFIKKG